MPVAKARLRVKSVAKEVAKAIPNVFNSDSNLRVDFSNSANCWVLFLTKATRAVVVKATPKVLPNFCKLFTDFLVFLSRSLKPLSLSLVIKSTATSLRAITII